MLNLKKSSTLVDKISVKLNITFLAILLLLSSCNTTINLGGATNAPAGTTTGGAGGAGGGGCGFLLDGTTTTATPNTVLPLVNGAQTQADFTFTANSQIGIVESSTSLPDSNKRVFAIKLYSPVGNVAAGFGIMNNTVDLTDITSIATTWPNNNASIFGNAGTGQYEWWAMSTSMNDGWTIDTADAANGDVMAIYIDGTSWYASLNGAALTANLGVQANNIPIPAGANRIYIAATTTTAGVNAGSVGIELLITKAELVAAGVSLAVFPAGAQTLCDETL